MILFVLCKEEIYVTDELLVLYLVTIEGPILLKWKPSLLLYKAFFSYEDYVWFAAIEDGKIYNCRNQSIWQNYLIFIGTILFGFLKLSQRLLCFIGY